MKEYKERELEELCAALGGVVAVLVIPLLVAIGAIMWLLILN